MRSYTNPAKFICLSMLMAISFPLGAMAGCNIDFAELGLKDSIPSKLPLQKDNIIVSFDKDNCTFNSEQNTLSFSKGASITVKSKNGEKITGIRLLTLNKENQENAKKKKPELFSCDNGEFENDIWKGYSDAITFQCLENCIITGIRSSFNTDPKEAYATRSWFETKFGYSEWYDGIELVFHYDEKKNLHVEDEGEDYYYGTKNYSINDNKEYPEWYGVDCDIVIFDSSFADYHPKRTSHWFDGLSCEIKNIQYLNTSEVTDMSYMFANFSFEEINKGVIFENIGIDDGQYSSFSNENYLNREELFFLMIIRIYPQKKLAVSLKIITFVSNS